VKKYVKTASLSFFERTNGGIIYILPGIVIKICTLIPLIYLWRVVMSSGVSVGMSLEQMLTYAYVSSILADMLVVQTAASGWLSEGVLLKLYGRPLPIFGQLAAQTVGGWMPELLLFSLPMVLISPLFGVSLIPASPLFPISLLLCISLGFAIELLFACLSIKLRNMNWLIGRMRMAITAVLSGTIIPIALLPFGLAQVMKYQPFASLGGAPLTIFVGSANVPETLMLQVIWNLILWPVALFIWKKSQEGMVSYGG
jgi:ABC-2 type transport system permease protein